MGWSIGFDDKWKRDVGYGVPCTCDHPDCEEEIDRGLAYVCGGEPFGGDMGCGLYFCDKHMYYTPGSDDPQMCERCCDDELPYPPKPDTLEWVEWKLTDDSWAGWRDDNPDLVKEMNERLGKVSTSQVMKF